MQVVWYFWGIFLTICSALFGLGVYNDHCFLGWEILNFPISWSGKQTIEVVKDGVALYPPWNEQFAHLEIDAFEDDWGPAYFLVPYWISGGYISAISGLASIFFFGIPTTMKTVGVFI